MESDAYALFTECHRFYIQGTRRALRERLESIYGNDWFTRGVLPALSDRQRENLEVAQENQPAHDCANLLDAMHFGRIVNRNHAAVFADAFTELDSVLAQLRFLAAMRNEWAHISSEGLPLPKVIAAIQAMQRILVALRCREAVEIDMIVRQRNSDQTEIPIPDTILAVGNSEDYDDSSHPSDHPLGMAGSPLELWRTLRSYLVTESLVESVQPTDSLGNELEGRVIVTVRVSNVAPVSADRPSICFRDVRLATTVEQRDSRDRRPSRDGDLGYLEPGQTVERQFTLYSKQIAQFEFQVFGKVDPERFFSIQQDGGLPGEVVRPILDEFNQQFEALGIKEPLSQALASITTVQPAMTLADASRVRQELARAGPLIEEKQSALNNLYEEFHLDLESPLGAQCHQVGLFLGELHSRIQAVDAAIGDTNLEAIKLAVDNLEQLQLSVLQVEETIRRMLNA